MSRLSIRLLNSYLQRIGIATTCESWEGRGDSVLGRWLDGWTPSPPVTACPTTPFPTALYWANRRCPNINYNYRDIQRLFRQGTIRMWDPSTDRVVRVAKDDTLPLGARLLFPINLHCRDNSQNSQRDQTSRSLRAPPDKALARLEKSLKKAILLDMPGYFVLNKPAGIAVQRGSKVNISIDDLLPQLLHGGEPSSRADQWLDMPRLVHRLDKDVTGALIIAKGADNAALLAKIFQNATKGVIEKEYWAIVCTSPSSNLHKRSQAEITTIQAPIQHGKHETVAITRFEKIKSSENGNFCLLRLEPVTGRKHQIRIHCARELIAPIVGDDRYGEIRSSYQRELLKSFGKTKPLFLHCRSLSIRLPGHAPVQVVAPFPETWIQASSILGWNLP